jgi:hypothetical protein
METTVWLDIGTVPHPIGTATRPWAVSIDRKAGDFAMSDLCGPVWLAHPPNATQALGHNGFMVPQSLSVLPLPAPRLLLGGED